MRLPFFVRLTLALIGLIVGLSVLAMGIGGMLPRQEIAVVPEGGIYLFDIRTDITHNLAPPAAGLFGNVAWSPNQSRLAFDYGDKPSGESRAIYVMDDDGSSVRRLTHFESCCPVWSQDGTQLAYLVAVGYSNDIFVLDLQTGSTRNLTPNGGLPRNFTWSPDGLTIAFLNFGGPEDHFDLGGHIYLVGSNGGHLREIPRLTPTTSISSPVWAPNGERIAFTGSSSNGNQYIRIVDTSGHDLHSPIQVSDTPTIPTWSPDGRYLAYVNSNGIFAVGTDLNTPPQLLVDRSSIPWLCGLFWSSDSRQVIFATFSDGMNSLPSVFAADVTGATLRALNANDVSLPRLTCQ